MPSGSLDTMILMTQINGLRGQPVMVADFLHPTLMKILGKDDFD